MRAVSIALVLLACGVIAVGRSWIRRARRGAAGGRRWAGWGLVGLGVVVMIAGVVLWE